MTIWRSLVLVVWACLILLSRSALGSGPEEHFARAWGLLEHGMTLQAIAALESHREDAAIHEPTRRALAQVDRLKAPCPDPDLGPLRARLAPERFRESRSDHFLLLHQLPEVEATERLETLERVATTFLISFAAQGLALKSSEQRLVSVYFADRRDYSRFLRQAGGGVFADTQGYYHPSLKTVFAFDTRCLEEQKAGRRAIANRASSGESRSELDRRALLLDQTWRATDLGIAAHETVHQLTVESGLAPRLEAFPTWLLEGLATQYEVVREGRWAGFNQPNELRLPDWRAIHPVPRLSPLIRDVGFGQGYRRDLYAQSWALVYFLQKEHPDQFRTFLDRLRSPSPRQSPPSDRTMAAFREAFGPDLVRWETSWRSYIGEIQMGEDDHRTRSEVPGDPIAGPDPKRSLVGPVPGH